MTTTNAPSPEKTRRSAASVWLAAIGVLVFLRYRGGIGLYRSLHEWMAESGTADWARNLDNDVLMLVLGVGLWAWIRRGSEERSAGLLGDIGVGGRVARGCIVGLVIALPMLLLGVVTGGAIAFGWPMVRVVVTAPFAEEWFFRGVLVLTFVRLAGVSFWPTAIVSGVLFGLMHVRWTGDGFAQGWPHGLITAAGGIWYAWLAREWGRNLWVVIAAHALMNLASPWYGTGNATWHEIGRGTTIALGTLMTIRPAWLRMGWARRARRSAAARRNSRRHGATSREDLWPSSNERHVKSGQERRTRHDGLFCLASPGSVPHPTASAICSGSSGRVCE